MRATAIILTGGKGERVKELDTPKQFYHLLGKPLFVYSLELYEKIDEVQDIILVINPDYQLQYNQILSDFNFKKLKCIVNGGENRQISVEHGINAVDSADYVILHDGANPTTRQEFVKTVFEGALSTGASTGCVSPRDTVVKVIDDRINQVFERKQLAYTCTPQVYRLEVIRKAIDKAKKDELTNRPTVELVKSIGVEVKFTLCPFETIKVTTFKDFKTAENILRDNS